MIWPIGKTNSLYSRARIISLIADEAAGELTLRVDFDGLRETELVYEGMFYSQLGKEAWGQWVKDVRVITLANGREEVYRQAMDKLYHDCDADDAFMLAMEERGNRLFAHHMEDGVYLVLAKRLAFGETRLTFKEDKGNP